jgi:transposase
VANVRELRAISHSDRKSDKVDAEKVARYARLDPEILRPIAYRTIAQRKTLIGAGMCWCIYELMP